MHICKKDQHSFFLCLNFITKTQGSPTFSYWTCYCVVYLICKYYEMQFIHQHSIINNCKHAFFLHLAINKKSEMKMKIFQTLHLALCRSSFGSNHSIE